MGADMGRGHVNASESRFLGYVEGLASVIGHADRVGPLHDYCLGLMAARGRKSVEPMAAHIAPHRTSAQHQSMLHFIGRAGWSDEEVLAKVREMVLPQIERHGPIEAWIVDDTGFPKKGEHSVGVSHQYCGQLGKQSNCQVAVTLSIANHHVSLPVAYQLYLPKAWADDRARRAKAGVPEEISFQTKNEIALAHIRWACEAGLPRGNALFDAGFGHDSKFREGVSELGLTYCAGIQPQTLVWNAGIKPGLASKKARHNAVSVKKLALGLPAKAWRTIKWREGTNDLLSSRFARVRVAVAPSKGSQKKPKKEWLLIEWPKGEAHRPNTGSQRFQKPSRSSIWSMPPNCAGASSATIRNSSRRLASDTSRDADGAASITTPPCALRLTDSWSPKGRRFPPQDHVEPLCSKNLPYPTVTDPEDPPLRPERHIPNSIATMRIKIIDALVALLPRCPYCRTHVTRRGRKSL